MRRLLALGSSSYCPRTGEEEAGKGEELVLVVKHLSLPPHTHAIFCVDAGMKNKANELWASVVRASHMHMPPPPPMRRCLHHEQPSLPAPSPPPYPLPCFPLHSQEQGE